MDIYWASFTLFFIFLPMLMSCILSFVRFFQFNSIQYNFNDKAVVEIEEQTTTDPPEALEVEKNDNGKENKNKNYYCFQLAFEKFISKASQMPKPLRHVPLLQSVYHMYVMSELAKIALVIKEEKKLLKNLDKILEESGIVSGRKYFYGNVHGKLVHHKILNKFMDKKKWHQNILYDEHKRGTKQDVEEIRT